MQKIIVFDSDHPGALENWCFREEAASQGLSFTVELAKQAVSKGFEIMTGDVLLKKTIAPETRIFCISEMHSQRTNAILKEGAIPVVCICMESPIIARDFYLNINKYAGRFLHCIQFKGTAMRLNKSATEFSIMYFPVYSRTPLPAVPWPKRKRLVLINRNKRAFYTDRTTLKGAIRSVLARVKFSLQKWRDPWMRSPEIYKDRIEAIYYFSTHDTFELYGAGWENRIVGFPLKYHRAALKALKGTIGNEDKLIVMSQFKFAICFENCSFSGYVTEKIFDCFLAGCIPIYYGAPDIEEFVPAGTFIDYRKFKNMKDLDRYLSNLGETEAHSMIEKARKFLSSTDFDKYYLQNFTSGVIEKIEKWAGKG